MNKPYKSNRTFGDDDLNFNFNACVGQNGQAKIQDYQFGYQLAVNVMINFIKQDTRYVDPLIYPLLFSARHSIELFIKEIISHLEIINKMIYNKTQFKNHFLIHDISILWEHLKKISSFDKRIKDPISRLDEYITDYFDIDLTGETFRYPFDTKNKHHLDDFSVINVLKFEKRFNEMNSIIEYVYFIIDNLTTEYDVGTFICGLSRHEIEEISKKLPKKSNWSEPSFKVISEQIKSEYNIPSNKAYSEILDLIKKHKEFSYNIGITNISTVLTKDEYNIFKMGYLYSRAIERPEGIQTVSFEKLFEINNDLANTNQKPYLEKKNDFINSVIDNLSLESIAALCSFYDIGHENLYSEQYEKVFDFYLKGNKYNLVLDRLSDGYRRVDDIEKGIKKCGQVHLL